jgi:hypothetical protein
MRTAYLALLIGGTGEKNGRFPGDLASPGLRARTRKAWNAGNAIADDSIYPPIYLVCASLSKSLESAH